jgi:hypothetical protein
MPRPCPRTLGKSILVMREEMLGSVARLPDIPSKWPNNGAPEMAAAVPSSAP